MKIYRIENVIGEGPYNCADGSRQNFSKLNLYRSPCETLHPLPEDDELLGRIWLRYFYNDLTRNWKFGFDSIGQLTMWFDYPGVFEALELDGFMIAEYDVEDGHFHVGMTQSIFEKHHSTFVRYFTFNELQKKEIAA